MAEALVEAVLYQGVPGAGDTTLFTVPANHAYTVSTIAVTNTTGTAATITFARNGTAATAANQIIASALSVGANGTEIIEGPFVFAATDTFRALQGTASALTVYVSGADHTLT